MRFLMVALVWLICVSHSYAKGCSPFEKQVYELAKKVASFQHSDGFVNQYAWGLGGPYNKWRKKIEALQQDDENVRSLMGNHGFTPMSIITVADEYRQMGELDDFYAREEASIKSLKCK